MNKENNSGQMGRVEIYFEDYHKIRIKRQKIYKWLNKVIENEKLTFSNLVIILCSDNYLLELNQKYLKHNDYTDIITFNNSEKGIISGDLYISVDRVKENAARYKVKFEEELIRVIVHGTLHLMKYNDKTKPEKMIMREKENFYINTYLSIE
jgi:rRNA maturation RNase YbeY